MEQTIAVPPSGRDRGWEYTSQAVPSLARRPRPSMGDSPATQAPLIEIRGVSAGYENKRQKTRLIALRDVFLDVYSGEFLAIVGPSGCGKTTLINMIAGFMKPLDGTILVGGESVQGPGARRDWGCPDLPGGQGPRDGRRRPAQIPLRRGRQGQCAVRRAARAHLEPAPSSGTRSQDRWREPMSTGTLPTTDAAADGAAVTESITRSVWDRY